MELNTKFLIETFILCLKAIPITLKITIVTLIISVPIGFLFGFAAYRKVPVLNQFFKVIVSFLRGIPFILVIFLIYSVFPTALNSFLKSIGSDFNIYDLDNIIYAYIIFSITQSAQLAAVFKSALETVPDSQLEAALAIGMTTAQGYRRIILPQALSAATPVLASSVTDLIKSTSLAFSLSVMDITATAKIAAAGQMAYVEAYLDIFLIYVLLIVIVERLFKIAEKRLKVYKTA